MCAVASTLSVASCFAYRSTEPTALRPGQVVRLTLNDSGTRQLTQQVGPRVASLDGRVIGPRDSVVALAVTELLRVRSGEEFWTGDSVVVPVRGVSSLFVKELDRKRSALAAAGAVVALVVTRQAITGGGIFGSRGSRAPGSQ